MALQVQRLRNQEISGGESESQAGVLWERIKARPRRWREFLHEVRLEMHQVTWPTREQVISTTFVVIVAVAFFSLFFFGVDSTVGYFMTWMLHYFKH
jgi:preprotein translocase subunit SecE